MLSFVFIVIYLLLVLIRPQDYPQWIDAGIGIPLLPLALVAALGTWIASRNKRFDEPQYLLLVLFLVVTSASVAISGWIGGAQAQFTTFAPTVVSFVLLANAVDSQRRTTGVMTLFVVCAMVLAIHGVDQAQKGVGWTGMSPVEEDGRIQYVGIFSDPNDLGMLFVICLPMAVYLGNRGGLMGLRRLFWYAGAALLFYGIYLTNSRGAFLAVVAMTAAYVWIRRGWFMASLLGAGALVVLKLMPSRLNELDVQESSAQGRVDAWYEGVQMFIANPVFGVGTGRFTEYHDLTAHNSLVLVLAENGIVGLTVWLAFLGYCYWMMVRILRFEPEDLDDEGWWAWQGERRIALTLFLSMVGFAASAFFLSRSYVILLYLLAALVVAHFSGVRARFPALQPLRLQDHLLRWPLIAVLVVIAFYVILKILLAMG